MQIGFGDSKYVVIFKSLQPGHDTVHVQCAIRPFTQGQDWLDIGVIGPLQPNISVTVQVTKKVSTDHL